MVGMEKRCEVSDGEGKCLKHRSKEKGSQLIFQLPLMYSRSTGERDDLLFRQNGFELIMRH